MRENERGLQGDFQGRTSLCAAEFLVRPVRNYRRGSAEVWRNPRGVPCDGAKRETSGHACSLASKLRALCHKFGARM